MRRVFQRFHLVVRVERVGADGDRAVIGEEDRVARLDESVDGLRQLVATRHNVGRQRDAAEGDNRLWERQVVQGDACQCEAGRLGRMRVDRSVDIGTLAVAVEMQSHLR